MIGKDCSSFNIHDELKSLSLDEVKEIQKENSLSYAVATINVNGDLNLGSIIRTSVIFGAKKFFVIGKRRYDRRSTVGAHNYIDIEFIEENIDEKLEYILNKIEKDYTPCFIEQGGKNIKEQNFSYFNKPPCIIFGSESSGFSEKTIKYINDNNYSMYSIKQYGVIRSLNVSAAAAITINKVADDIISSRSNNYDRGLIWL